MSKVIYGVGGFRPDHPTQGKIAEHDDTTATVTRWDARGNVIDTRPYTPDETAEAAATAAETTRRATRATTEATARAARTVNRTYLALAAPTAAQRNTQVDALTRQMQAILRRTLDDYDTPD